jgi:hypothetical protein
MKLDDMKQNDWDYISDKILKNNNWYYDELFANKIFTLDYYNPSDINSDNEEDT